MFLLLRLACSSLIRPHEEKQFVAFMREHGKIYTGAEYHFRLGVFMANARFVQEFNRRRHSFSISLNKFSVYTQAEYVCLLGVNSRGSPRLLHANPLSIEAPDSLDYRDQGAVNTPVRDQGNCGSCWAFSAITAQESQWFLQSGSLVQFSESNLVDCVITNSGCDGGWPHLAYEYVTSNQQGKINLGADYPYKAVDGPCRYDSTKAIGNIVSYVNVTQGDEIDLKNKLYQYGPASICIDASSVWFMLYSSGIYDNPNCAQDVDNLDHAVGLVGYGTEGLADYWIVRNSWGPDWGENGYVRMARNKGNQCGSASVAVIPRDA
jgi:cathepsin L